MTESRLVVNEPEKVICDGCGQTVLKDRVSSREGKYECSACVGRKNGRHSAETIKMVRQTVAEVPERALRMTMQEAVKSFQRRG